VDPVASDNEFAALDADAVVAGAVDDAVASDDEFENLLALEADAAAVADDVDEDLSDDDVEEDAELDAVDATWRWPAADLTNHALLLDFDDDPGITGGGDDPDGDDKENGPPRMMGAVGNDDAPDMKAICKLEVERHSLTPKVKHTPPACWPHCLWLPQP